MTYEARVTSDWDLTAQASYFETFNEADTTILPPGAVGGLFPDGVSNDLEFLERQIRTEVGSTYSGITGHILRGGIGFYHTSLDDIEERRNVLLGPGGTLIPTGISHANESFQFSRAIHSPNVYSRRIAAVD